MLCSSRKERRAAKQKDVCACVCVCSHQGISVRA